MPFVSSSGEGFAHFLDAIDVSRQRLARGSHAIQGRLEPIEGRLEFAARALRMQQFGREFLDDRLEFLAEDQPPRE